MKKQEATSKSLPAGTISETFALSRRDLMRGGVAVAASAMLPRAAHAFTGTSTQPNPGTTSAAASTISNSAIGTLADYFIGFSQEMDGATSNSYASWSSDLIQLYKNLGHGVLRFGGNSADQYYYNASGTGTANMISPFPKEIAPQNINRVRDFCTATGYKLIWGVNLNNTNNSASTSAANSAQEAQRVHQTLGSALLGIEIGNESDQAHVDGASVAGYASYSAFDTRWTQYRTAILNLDSTCSILGPVGVGTGYFQSFVSAHANDVQFFTQHYYRFFGNSYQTQPTVTPTVSDLVGQPDTHLRDDCLTPWNSAISGTGKAIRIAECNSVTRGGKPAVSNSYASALWCIEYCMTAAAAGITGVNFHGESSSPTGYEALALQGGSLDQNGNLVPSHVLSVQPLYYGMYMVSQMQHGTMLNCSTAAGATASGTLTGNKYTRAYAVRDSGGTLRILIVNTDSSHHLNVTIDLYATPASAKVVQMTQSSGGAAASLAATDGVSVQNAQFGTDGSFNPVSAYTLSWNGPQLTCYSPLLSAVMVTVTF